MVKIGMDLGKRRSDVCVMATVEKVSERFQLPTTREGLQKHFANRPVAEIAIEACRDSRWVRDVLIELGHDVVVVDTSRVRAIGVGHGRRKNDRNDAEALARALWAGVAPKAHVLSERSARLRDLLLTRQQFVAQRTSLVTMLRGQMQARGLRAPQCRAKDFCERIGLLKNDFVEATHVKCTVAVLRILNDQIIALEADLKALALGEESFERLSSIPGVKLIVGLAFIAAVDEPRRFRSAHQVEAYLGLVPSETSTGGKQRLGRITKVGNNMARWALVQAAQTLLRMKRCADDPLLEWANQVAKRRGKRVAIVAIARRLAGILWAMWCDGTFYDAALVGRSSARGLSRRARIAKQEADAMARTVSAA